MGVQRWGRQASSGARPAGGSTSEEQETTVKTEPKRAAARPFARARHGQDGRLAAAPSSGLRPGGR